jgi:hypothetical protein
MSGPPLDPARASAAPLSGRPRAAPRRAPRGAVSWVTLLFLVGFVVAAYLGWTWAPVYAEHYAVKKVVHDFMNQAVKNPHDDQLRQAMVAKLRSLAEVETVDEDGEPVVVPAVEVDPADVSWERDAESQPPMLRVSFEYTREVELPLLNRTAYKVFVVDLENDLTRPDWGPAR